MRLATRRCCLSCCAQIAPDEAIASVTADGAYDTRACRDAIAQRGAVAVIAPRKNARLWRRSSPGSESRNEAVRACQRLGTSIWKTWSGYHRRSLVETKMHCLKRLGERVTARTFERQVVELHARGRAQPLQSDRPAADRAGGCRGMSPSGVGVGASARGFVQQTEPVRCILEAQQNGFHRHRCVSFGSAG